MISTVAFLAAKARANIGASPTKNTVSMMLNSPTLSDAENILSEYPFYRNVLQQSRPSVDILKFEGILRREFGRMLHQYSVGSQQSVRRVLDAFALRLEVENLQILFRSIVGNNHDEDILNFMVPVTDFGMRTYQRILRATSPKNAVDFIYHSMLRKQVNRAFDRADNDDELIFYIVSGLEHAAYQYAYKHNKMIRNEVDLLNLETVARAISLGINPSDWIIPKIGVVAKNIRRLERLSSPRAVISTMINSLPYSTYLREVLNADDEHIVSVLERQVDIMLMKHHSINFRIFGRRPESLFDFFSLKYEEMRDMGKIFLGKANGIDPEKIKASLRYFLF